MKKQISNIETSNSLKFLIFLHIGLFIIYQLFARVKGLFGESINLPIPIYFIIIISFSFFYFMFIGRFYKVEIDDKNLYYKGLLSNGHISLKSLSDIRIGLIPIRQFFTKAYNINVYYLDEFNNEKSINFLSKNISFHKDGDEIHEVIMLKEIIFKNKNANETLD